MFFKLEYENSIIFWNSVLTLREHSLFCVVIAQYLCVFPFNFCILLAPLMLTDFWYIFSCFIENNCS